MKLLLGSVEALFRVLPEDALVAYWETISRTTYESGLPKTCYKIRVTAAVGISDQRTVAEVTVFCGTHIGHPHEQMDKNQKEKVVAYKHERQKEIAQLAHRYGVELRYGILTMDPAESLHGTVIASKEEKP